MSFAGMLIGAVVLSPMSDQVGRRPTHLLGLFLYLVGCALMYFHVTYWTVIIGTLINGIGMYSRLVVSYLYCLELVDEVSSKIVATIAMTLNAACAAWVALYYIAGYRDAEFLILVAMFITLFSLAFGPFLPESPKLLYEEDRYEEVRDQLRKIARWNGIKDPQFQPFVDEVKKDSEKTAGVEKEAEDMKKHSSLREQDFIVPDPSKRPRLSRDFSREGLPKNLRERSISNHSH